MSELARGACLHFDTRFFFKRSYQGGGVFISEAKGNGRCKISFNNTQRWNRGLQAFAKFLNQACVLEHELEREASRKIAFQNILTVADEKR